MVFNVRVGSPRLPEPVQAVGNTLLPIKANEIKDDPILKLRSECKAAAGVVSPWLPPLPPPIPRLLSTTATSATLEVGYESQTQIEASLLCSIHRIIFVNAETGRPLYRSAAANLSDPTSSDWTKLLQGEPARFVVAGLNHTTTYRISVVVQSDTAFSK